MAMEDAESGHGHGSRQLCGAKKHQGDGTCRRSAGAGTDHLGFGRCSKHGGNTATQAVSASRELALREARVTVMKLGYEAVENPYRQLQLVAGELVAVKDMLRAEVERLEDVRYEGRSGEQIRGELLAYQAALRDTAGVLTSMTRLKIDEKLVQISEAQARIVVTALNAALDHAGITGQRLDECRKVVAQQLRLAGDRGAP